MNRLTTVFAQTTTPAFAAAFQVCTVVSAPRPMMAAMDLVEVYNLVYQQARLATASNEFRRLFQASTN